MKTKMVIGILAALQLLAAAPVQANSIENYSEEEIRIALELQAAQIEAGIVQTEAQGEQLTTESRETLQAFASAIRAEAQTPHLKRRLLKLWTVPRAILKGIAYTGMAVPAVIFAPVTFSFSFIYGAISGNDPSPLQDGIAGGTAFVGATVAFAGEYIASAAVAGWIALPVLGGCLVPIHATVRLICSDSRRYKNAERKKFCAGVTRIDNIWDRVDDAGENSGLAVHEFFSRIFKKKR